MGRASQKKKDQKLGLVMKADLRLGRYADLKMDFDPVKVTAELTGTKVLLEGKEVGEVLEVIEKKIAQKYEEDLDRVFSVTFKIEDEKARALLQGRDQGTYGMRCVTEIGEERPAWVIYRTDVVS